MQKEQKIDWTKINKTSGLVVSVHIPAWYILRSINTCFLSFLEMELEI